MFPSKKKRQQIYNCGHHIYTLHGIRTRSEITAGKNPYLTYLFPSEDVRQAVPYSRPSLLAELLLPETDQAWRLAPWSWGPQHHPCDLSQSFLWCNIYLVLLREISGLCSAWAFNFPTAQSSPPLVQQDPPQGAHSSVQSSCQRNHFCCCLFKEACNLLPLVPGGATISVGTTLSELKITHLLPLYLEGEKKVCIKFPALFLLLCFNHFSDSGLICLPAFLVLLKTIVLSFLQKAYSLLYTMTQNFETVVVPLFCYPFITEISQLFTQNKILS